MKIEELMEKIFERGLWATRYIVLLAVIFSMLGAISLFVIGSKEIIESVIEYIKHSEHGHSNLLAHVITAVDLYLIGVVLIIFSFGIYELFISKIDIAIKNTDVTILEVRNIDELKQKIIKVIIMVLIVSFFEKILKLRDNFNSPLDMLYFAISIFALAIGVYFINKNKYSKTS